MDRLLARLERRIGRFAIPNLIFYVVGGMGLFWVLSMTYRGVLPRLVLDMEAVRAGQVWRLVTFMLIPDRGSFFGIDSPVWTLFSLYFTWWVGSSLEQHWGSFKFNVYYLLGALGTVVAAVLTGPQTNFWLNASLFLAFATLFPNVQVMLMLILPIQVKWLGLLDALFLAYSFLVGGATIRAAIAAAMVNYILFFGGHWLEALRMRNSAVRARARRETFKGNEPAFGQRTCAVCGAREADGADIRVCSCEKCGGQPRTLCLEHARNH